MAVDKKSRRLRIKLGIRRKISGTAARPRLSVFKSNKGIYAQIIDDLSGATLAQANSFELGVNNNANLEVSKKVGLSIAQRAKDAGVEAIVFDRGGYIFHGKVKALADGAREGGLKF
jgi:large subunit ribosomal protein L18